MTNPDDVKQTPQDAAPAPRKAKKAAAAVDTMALTRQVVETLHTVKDTRMIGRVLKSVDKGLASGKVVLTQELASQLEGIIVKREENAKQALAVLSRAGTSCGPETAKTALVSLSLLVTAENQQRDIRVSALHAIAGIFNKHPNLATLETNQSLQQVRNNEVVPTTQPKGLAKVFGGASARKVETVNDALDAVQVVYDRIQTQRLKQAVRKAPKVPRKQR